MGEKGNKTKDIIIKASAKLFSEKGYALVTMKDICEATAMSRGGLYRHFASTKEIFIAMLDLDIEINRKAVEDSLRLNTPRKVIFEHYLKQELSSIINPNHGIFLAIHEFAFVEIDQRYYFKCRLKGFNKNIEFVIQKWSRNR